MAPNVAAAIRLMLVTDDRVIAGRDPIPLCQAAAKGGVTSVQLRLKQASAAELVELARRLCAELSIPVIVNDRADVALAGGAAGVHLGPEDVPVGLVRRISPPGFLIGASVGTDEEAAAGAGADYWGVGPWRESGTKPDAGRALGGAGFERIVRAAPDIPCIAIGGVRPEDVDAVVRSGGAGVAVVGGILGAPDIERAARSYAQQLSRLTTHDSRLQ